VDNVFPEADESAGTDPAAGLVSLSFITATLRRRARFWCVAAVIGLLLGIGFYVKFPPKYQAATSVILTHAPGDIQLDAMSTDQAVAQSRSVAALAIRNLGLHETVSAFVNSYSATIATDRVLDITASGPSSAEAIRRTNAVAKAFLQFRADQLQTNEKMLNSALLNQLSQQRDHVAALASQITALSGQPATPAQQSRLTALRDQHTQAVSSLYTQTTSVQDSLHQNQLDTSAQVQQSTVLDPASPVKHSRVKVIAEYTVTALIAGLALGMAIVIVHALISDRLRRRDDVAHALGAPVRLSVGRVRLHRVLPGRRGLPAAGLPEIRRITGFLRRMLPGELQDASLALITVGEPDVAALALAGLAQQCAEQGTAVIVADLCPGRPAGRLLGNRHPGLHEVTLGGARLTLFVPDRDDAVPVGPLPLPDTAALSGGPSQELAAAWSAAGLILTLATLDPMLGAEHIASWAGTTIAVVGAGESSSTRIHATAEMLRVAGPPLTAAVLVGADKTDESIGTITPPAATGGDGDELLRVAPR
jgi:capsular polysaccharide biosynthesis protein